MPSTETTDFETILPIEVLNRGVNITLVTLNDDISLEYEDSVLLRFSIDPHLPFESTREYIRDTATVNINDNDRKYDCGERYCIQSCFI